VYPSYYEKPFHAYEKGNLCWEAAYEFEPAALTVHAPIFASDGKELLRNGDDTLRSNFHRNMCLILNKKGCMPKRILDIGCAGGLSTVKLATTFPEAEVIGIDLSPYMLSVAKFQLDNKPALSYAKKTVTYLHASGEDSTLASGDVDLVSICLVSHELPTSAAKAIFDEAYRILPHGGAFSLMDMDPKSSFFQKFASNPFAFTAFKSTEPWIQEYISMDLESTLLSCGFKDIEVKSNSPRHRTVVAFKS
jgi:ubiquinone/menaquinone biosynthesis C-methylase UbiE